MQSQLIYKLEQRADILAIDSVVEGLCYITSPEDDHRIAIAGEKGLAIMTVAQAQALLSELPDVLDLFVIRREYALRNKQSRGAGGGRYEKRA
ncbi:hypothetical protein SDC9_134467 [bioreactor metagenome]|uniref:Uncharacterized protein n=1 Tax=bioreactor metagenome TaxID=1076179 RepID=A0A645DDE8_9ZZZZ